MPTDAIEDLMQAFATCFGFVGSILAFLPIPGLSQMSVTIRAAAALAISCCLLPIYLAQGVPNSPFLSRILIEAGTGMGIGLCVSILSETLTFSAQLLATQAGFNYATTIDPTNLVDTGALQALANLLGGFLFFAFDFHHAFIRILVMHFVDSSRGGSLAGPAVIGEMLKESLSLAMQLSLPVVAVLVITDVALAVLSRLQSQLQLLHLLFPAKVLLTLLLLGFVVREYPRIYAEFGHSILLKAPVLARHE